jgi:hypothetical protein
MSWKDILKEEAQRGAPEFPPLINWNPEGAESPFNYYTLQEVIQNAAGTPDYGVYYADYPNHPESVIHLEAEEALPYAIDEDERGYDGPKLR